MEPKFPTTVVLEDTGERRYPTDGEHYRWANNQGKLSEVCLFDEAVKRDFNEGGGSNTSWAFPPTHYAIYRIKE